MLVAPATFLRWFRGMARTNGRNRVFGALFLTVGAIMVWAGASEEASFNVNEQRTLAFILSVLGWGIVGITPLIVLFPVGFRALANAFVPSDPSESLIGWRIMGLAQVIISGLFIYFGALAL